MTLWKDVLWVGRFMQAGVGDVRLHLALRRVDQRGLRRHLNGFRNRTHFEADFDRGQVSNFQIDPLLPERAEAGRGHRQRVDTRRQVGKPVVATLVCLRLLRADQRGTRNFDLRFDHEGASWILHGALYSRRRFLSKRQRQDQERREYHQQHLPFSCLDSHVTSFFCLVCRWPSSQRPQNLGQQRPA